MRLKSQNYEISHNYIKKNHNYDKIVTYYLIIMTIMIVKIS